MGAKKVHEDQKYIDGLAQNNSFVIQAIYDRFADKVVHYIRANNGDDQQAQDVIQETLVTLYHQAKEKGLQLTCPFDAYFFLLCKRRWLNVLKKKGQKEVTIQEEIVSHDERVAESISETSLYEEKQELFQEMFEKLGQACKELLRASFTLPHMEEVAASLGVTYAYARKKKSLCIGKLTEMVQASPRYAQLKP